MIVIVGASLSKPHGCENSLTGRYVRPTDRATDKEVELPESLSDLRVVAGCDNRSGKLWKYHYGLDEVELSRYCTRAT